MVYSNIATLMKAVENLPMSATEDDALDASDRRVRRDLPDAFNVASGRLTFHYSITSSLASRLLVPYCWTSHCVAHLDMMMGFFELVHLLVASSNHRGG